MVPERLFTVREANDTLPLVRRIAADVLSTGRALRSLAQSQRSPEELDAEAKKLTGRLKDLMGEFDQVGCSYKDWSFEHGLVDFPSIIDDRRVSLCWRCDEGAIRFYHAENEGYSGRRVIPERYLPEAKDTEKAPSA